MTEENKPKKPRRKRRTKAQIEAEKAAAAAAVAAKSPIVDPKPQPTEEDFESPKEAVVVEMLEESVTLEEVAKEEPAASAKKQESEKLPEYIPQTGMSKLRQKMMQRRLKDQYAQGNRNNERTEPIPYPKLRSKPWSSWSPLL